MIRHYLKVAFRNMWKYRSQTFISIAGLAVGFACFAMATLWIRYETTFDSSLKNSDRKYCLYHGEKRTVPYPVAGLLKTAFPEIVNATVIYPYSGITKIDEAVAPMRVLTVDSSFVNMFNVKLVEGSMDFTVPGIRKAAITRNKARQLFGNESPVGKIINNRNPVNGTRDYTVCAVVEELSEHSNYPFDLLIGHELTGWTFPGEDHIIIELDASINVKAFEKKLGKHVITVDGTTLDGVVPRYGNMSLVPLISIYYKDPETERSVKFQHVVIFVIAGSLLILCTLFNYLSLFITRFKIRQKELALRVVFGASNRSLFALLSVEFLISLFVALLPGMFFMEISGSAFRETSGIKMDLTAIYFESATYIAGIILISLLAFVTTLAVFRRRTLNAGIHQRNRKLFRKTSIAVQLVISIGFMFCTAIILKQMYHLHNTGLGFKFDNSGSVFIWKPVDLNALHDKIKQIPEITETVAGYCPLIPEDPFTGLRAGDIVEWDERSEKAPLIRTGITDVSEQFLSFYAVKLVEGEMLSDTDSENDILINETAAKLLGWNKSVGKSFKIQSGQYRVKGVIQNIYCKSPTMPVEATVYRLRSASEKSYPSSILFKYRKGAWKSCKDKIAEITRTLYPKAEYPAYDFEICNSEHEYDKYLKSENTLLWILSLISLVCLLVCVFGFVSMVSLTCEERRREIAIRKINGATVKDILDIFFKEHLTLLAIGALIAFPAGYLIMKRWLENYVIRTEMSAWIYVAILLALIMAIVLCVGGQVYRTSRENPIEAIKS